MVMEFGSWRLVPVDRRNWELCHLHVGKARGRHKAGTEPTWHRMGRFYQYNTLAEAFRYAASCELMDRGKDEASGISDALREYERITNEFADAISTTLADAVGVPAHGVD